MSYTVTEEALESIQMELDTMWATADGVFHNVGLNGKGVERIVFGHQNQLFRLEDTINKAFRKSGKPAKKNRS